MDLRLLKFCGGFGVSRELGKIDGLRGEEEGVDARYGFVVSGLKEDGGVGIGNGFVVSRRDAEFVGNKDGSGDMAGVVGQDGGEENRGDSKGF